MFDIGFWEICLIGIVGLLVIGPDRLPGVMRKAGRWIGKAQHMINSVKSDINRELEAGELRELLGEQKKQIEALQDLVDDNKNAIASSTHEAMEAGEKSWAEEVAEFHAKEPGEQTNTPNNIVPAATKHAETDAIKTTGNPTQQQGTQSAYTTSTPNNAENRTTA